jgi:hypothetical protein
VNLKILKLWAYWINLPFVTEQNPFTDVCYILLLRTSSPRCKYDIGCISRSSFTFVISPDSRHAIRRIWFCNGWILVIDAFSFPWSNEYYYIFPPFSLITRCLQKIINDQSECLIILPLWPTQIYFASCKNTFESSIHSTLSLKTLDSISAGLHFPGICAADSQIFLSQHQFYVKTKRVYMYKY